MTRTVATRSFAAPVYSARYCPDAVRLNSRPVVIAAAVLGVVLIVLAFYYWAEPAKSLASWMPGHEAGSNHHHVKHGLASLLLGLALLAFAWFQSGPRRSRPAD